jgi:hypothetical protein
MDNIQLRRALAEIDGGIEANLPIVAVTEEGEILEITSVKFSHVEGGQIHINVQYMD